MLRPFRAPVLVAFLLLGCSFAFFPEISRGDTDANPSTPLRIGWIGPITGPNSKYNAHQAAQIAEDRINRSGGVNGRKLQLIFEDSRGDARTALSSARKLVEFDRVSFIVGGHGSPETLAIAPYLERSGVLMLASITSSPKLTSMGDLIFRITAPSLPGPRLVAEHLTQSPSFQRVAILYEETDYAQIIAEHLQERLELNGRRPVITEYFSPGQNDFRSILTRIRARKPDAFYLSIQAPDTALLVLQQASDLGMQFQVLGNEMVGNAVFQFPEKQNIFEGVIFAEPRFDPQSDGVKQLVREFEKRWGITSLPAGMWTAEAFDAVTLLADAIARCSDEVQSVKRCLYETKNYSGASGTIGFDEHGDGVREYILKRVASGKIAPLAP